MDLAAIAAAACFSLQVGDTAAALAFSPPVPSSISTAATSLSPSSLPPFPIKLSTLLSPFLALSPVATESVAVLDDSLVVRNPPVRLPPALHAAYEAPGPL